MKEADQLTALREFARRIIASVAEGSDVSESDVDEWAVELGMIETTGKGDEFILSDWMQVASPPDGLPYR